MSGSKYAARRCAYMRVVLLSLVILTATVLVLLSTFGASVAGTFRVDASDHQGGTKSPKANFGGQHGQTMSAKSGNPLTTVLVAAAIVAALYFGREVLLPMALAVLLSFVLAPPVKLLQRLYLPRFAAVTIVVLLAFGVIFGLATLMFAKSANWQGICRVISRI